MRRPNRVWFDDPLIESELKKAELQLQPELPTVDYFSNAIVLYDSAQRPLRRQIGFRHVVKAPPSKAGSGS